VVDIQERSLRLTFQDDWQAIKFDDTPWCASSQLSAYGVKAVDITALGPDGQHWWIEIKDCVGYEADNQPRLAETPQAK
jgi:hypothetical protein